MLKPTLYIPQKDSPKASLTSGVDNTATLLTLDDSSIFSNSNIERLTLGIDSTTTETVKVISYGQNNQITVIRGTPAYSWPSGTKVARVLNSADISEIHDYLKYLDNELGTTVANGLVTNGNSHNHVVGGAQIPTSGIQNGAITLDKLANNSVSTDKIVNGAVTDTKISDSAVTSVKVSNGAITSEKIGTNAITQDKIADGAVTYGKILMPFCQAKRILSFSVGSTPSEIPFSEATQKGASNMWSSSNAGRIYVPVTGFYFVGFSLGAQQTGSAGDYRIISILQEDSEPATFEVTGLLIGYAPPSGTGGFIGYSGSAIQHLYEGQYIHMYVATQTTLNVFNIRLSMLFIQ